MKISEEFLCYLWKFQLIYLPLFTTDNQELTINNPGIRNDDAGPDFSGAIIKIDHTHWAGNIEIHTKSSDWLNHNHQSDKKYESVILHVVYEDDLQNPLPDFNPIATLVLNNKFPVSHFHKYQYFMQNKQWVPCENQLDDVNEFRKNHLLSRLAIERLERKSLILRSKLRQNKNDFNQLFYVQLANCFGFKTNSYIFEMLANSLPYFLLQKNKDSLIPIEALLFGQAGMLEKDFIDEYPKCLKVIYAHLKNKYTLTPIAGHLWKYLRLRPVNFPSIRIAQLAQLIYKSDVLFSEIIECDKVSDLIKLFDIEASVYWNDHYHFDKKSGKLPKKLGKATINLILTNAVLPLLFIYGKQMDNDKFVQRSVKFLNQIKGETNAAIKKWKKLGLNTSSAFNTQALLELKTQYCDYKRCLDCEIGIELLKNAGSNQS